MIQLNLWNQADNRWKSKKMAPSALTLGSQGCLVTSISQSLKAFAIEDDPGKVCDKIVSVSGFLPSGDMIYSKLVEAYPSLTFVERVYTTNLKEAGPAKLQMTEAAKRIKRLLKLGQPVHLHVDNVASDGNPDHFVTAYEWGQELHIYNPDGGRMQKFSEAYGDPMKMIYGYVSILGPPTDFPPDGWPELGQVLNMLCQALKGNNTQYNLKDALNTLLNG